MYSVGKSKDKTFEVFFEASRSEYLIYKDSKLFRRDLFKYRDVASYIY